VAERRYRLWAKLALPRSGRPPFRVCGGRVSRGMRGARLPGGALRPPGAPTPAGRGAAGHSWREMLGPRCCRSRFSEWHRRVGLGDRCTRILNAGEAGGDDSRAKRAGDRRSRTSTRRSRPRPSGPALIGHGARKSGAKRRRGNVRRSPPPSRASLPSERGPRQRSHRGLRASRASSIVGFETGPEPCRRQTSRVWGFLVKTMARHDLAEILRTVHTGEIVPRQPDSVGTPQRRQPADAGHGHDDEEGWRWDPRTCGDANEARVSCLGCVVPPRGGSRRRPEPWAWTTSTVGPPVRDTDAEQQTGGEGTGPVPAGRQMETARFGEETGAPHEPAHSAVVQGGRWPSLGRSDRP